MLMSSKLTKKSLVKVPILLVKTPFLLSSLLAPKTLIPPTKTVISGALKLSIYARSIKALTGEIIAS